MRNLIALTFLMVSFLSSYHLAYAFQPILRPWTELAHESQMVGIIRVEGLEPGTDERPPLLRIELVRLFKGEYTSMTINATRLFLDLTDKMAPSIVLDPKGTALADYDIGSLYLAFMSPTKLKTHNDLRVMTLSGWEIMTLRPIRQNILGYHDDRDGSMLRDTYDFLSALDRFCEIDALEGDERKLAMRLLEKQLHRYPDHPSDLYQAFKWLSSSPKTSRSPASK